MTEAKERYWAGIRGVNRYKADIKDVELMRVSKHDAEVTRLTEALATVTAEQEQLLADSALRSDQRVAYEKLCVRLSVQKASEQEAIDAIKALCRDNERLALLAGKNRTARAERVEEGLRMALEMIQQLRGFGWEDAPPVHPYDKGYLGALDAMRRRIELTLIPAPPVTDSAAPDAGDKRDGIVFGLWAQTLPTSYNVSLHEPWSGAAPREGGEG